jgi:hypothetical protein
MIRSCLALTAVVLLALLVVGGVVGSSRGVNGVLAASTAAGICWVGSTIALLIAGYASRSNQAAQGHLLGMFFRLGLPLGAGMLLQMTGGPLADAGVFGLIVVFYLVTLVAETLLSLQFIKHSKSGESKSGDLKHSDNIKHAT